jgi:membrane protein implicated in regulation of membrane protease activity
MTLLQILNEYAVIIWFSIIILAAVIEASTMDLSSIWFSVGALFALLANAIGANEIVQVVIFLIVSSALLIGLRPIFKKYIKRNESGTNKDKHIGKIAICVKPITDGARGEVKIDGKIWTAISNEDIVLDEKVIVVAIEGVKLVVKKQQ